MSDPSQCSVALLSSARDRLSADDDTLKVPDRLFGNSENLSLSDSERDSERIQRTDSVALIWGVNFGEFHSQTSQCLLRAAFK